MRGKAGPQQVTVFKGGTEGFSQLYKVSKVWLASGRGLYNIYKKNVKWPVDMHIHYSTPPPFPYKDSPYPIPYCRFLSGHVEKYARR